MKKIASIILALAVSAGAFAKTFDAVLAEYSAIPVSASDWNERTAFVKANEADIAPAFAAWAQTDCAKYSLSETQNAGLTAEQKTAEIAKRGLFAYYYANFGDGLNVPDRVAAVLVPHRYGKDAAKYAAAKAAAWKIGGTELAKEEIVAMAVAADDEALITNFSIAEARRNIRPYINAMSKILLSMPDLAAAKTKCNEIEAYLILNNPTSDLLSKIQAVNRALTARLIDAKLTK